MKFIGIIPARYASTRLPGKPLVDIAGKTMIRRVYEQTSKVLSEVYVATDDDRIEKEVLSFGGKVVRTAVDHENGTSRCLEAAQLVKTKFGVSFDVIINIQGDEPMLHPGQLQDMLQSFEEKKHKFSTLIIPVSNPTDLENEGEVFVVCNKKSEALYFSRAVIPFLRGVPKTEWLQHQTYYKHLGLYAYTLEALEEFASMEVSALEKSECLEQLRWLENGNTINVAITSFDSYPVDTVEDLEKIRKMIDA